MKLYHGTTSKFDTFDIGKTNSSGAFGRGFYLSNSYSLAKQYSDGGEPMVCTVTMKNPYVIDYNQGYDATVERRRILKPAMTARDRLVELGYDGILVKQDNYVEAIAYYPSQIKIEKS